MQKTPYGWAALIALVALTVLLAGFSAFVGWHKTTAPLALLRENSAWTIHLPVALGRIVGVLELAAVAALAIALLVPRAARLGLLGAAWIGANHVVAAVFHIIHKEWHTLTQSGIVIALCLVWVTLWYNRSRHA
ncbi:DoxX family protein [Alteraurantiacibacter buctensis]|uniref:DoxX family protein n=1 Tax=Alteraurantiacibacter buctensis TaxID=1503981 RepID=A0A844Z1Z1_9SPHN|nr:DoxX family protein [Alteraurantiacibacter buctensis]MXO71923.1 hypothetical protein [Alteraurantiacibacter buctensis]